MKTAHGKNTISHHMYVYMQSVVAPVLATVPAREGACGVSASHFCGKEIASYTGIAHRGV